MYCIYAAVLLKPAEHQRDPRCQTANKHVYPQTSICMESGATLRSDPRSCSDCKHDKKEKDNKIRDKINPSIHKSSIPPSIHPFLGVCISLSIANINTNIGIGSKL